MDRPGHQFFPDFDRFWRFNSGSFAKRFCALTEPDAGSVPGPTGPTGRSGFDNLARTNNNRDKDKQNTYYIT
jgi:hypothetical protein